MASIDTRYDKTPDDELLALVANGDEAAFTSLYHRYRDRLFFFALDLTRSEEKAKDIVHDVFARIWEYRAALGSGGVRSLAPYLFQMTRNRRVDELRRFAKETLILAELAREKPAPPDDPESLLDYREMQALVQKGVETLPDRQKEVYRLHREKGLSFTEIAAQLGVSPSTVENHFTRAMRNLRDHLHRHFTATFFLCLVLGGTVTLS